MLWSFPFTLAASLAATSSLVVAFQTPAQPEIHAFSLFSSSTSSATPNSATDEDREAIAASTPANKNPSKSRKKPMIVACASNVELSRAVEMFVNAGDNVIEWGSTFSTVSTNLCNQVTPGGNAQLYTRQPIDIVDSNGDKHNRSHDNDDSNNSNSSKRKKVKKSGRTKTSNSRDFVNGGKYEEVCQVYEIDEKQYPSHNNDNGMSNMNQLSSSMTMIMQEQQSPVNAIVMDPSSMLGNDLPLTTLSTALGLLQHQPQSSGFSNSPIILLHSTKLASLARRLFHARHISPTRVVSYNDQNRNQQDHNQHQPIIVASVGVDEYRSTIPSIVGIGDEVLEIGCHGGYSAVLLHNQASGSAESSDNACDEIDNDAKVGSARGYCIGVDIGKKIIQRAKQDYPEIPFEVADGFNMLELLKLKERVLKDHNLVVDESQCQASLGYDVVYVDIGGLSSADGILETLALVDTISQCLHPRAMVFKSRCLQKLSNQLSAFSDIWNSVERIHQ